MTGTVINKPMGLSPVGYLNGADWDGKGRVYQIPSGDGNQYNIGDPVALATGADTLYGLQTVTRATVGANPCLGAIIALGAQPGRGPWVDPTDLTKTFIPATKTKAYYVLVADDPNIIYEIQEGGTGYTSANTLTYASACKNATFYYQAPATGAAFSAVVLDTVTNPPANTAGFSFKMLGLVQRVDNNYVSGGNLNQKWLVKMNNHPYTSGGVAGV